ncbi:hemerythrin domain-containing protein [Nocardioides jiangxiensis]|uniref:Hemerythrin domain-containing protein n=1 Tax=Nocardioides jiangxiensis TaxID=3064524 RepID=A0ABT9AZL4_9ACTN|nr:hemerythrin domain-containing protein [Nocardioides sp. WY-20]MDO7866777.1 hemerythrin domain-containing protein [Nocardioides sp. WY-20]
MNDVVELILKDHREVERLFEQLRTDPASRPGTLPVLTTLLFAHSRAEEAEVYPAVADEVGAADHVAHSQEEHVEADELLAALAETDPEGDDFLPALEKVVKAVSHHIEEEEETVLADMRDGLTVERLAELGDAFLASRAEHLGDQPEDITRDELRQQAANMDVPQPRGATKEELQETLRSEASK